MDYDVLEARYVRDHVVWVRFRDGKSGEVDLAPVLRGPVFEPHQNVEYFRQFTLDPRWHTLTWPNDTDVAPEYLHDHVR
jgi:Protein of unknown function (DUF2442)